MVAGRRSRLLSLHALSLAWGIAFGLLVLGDGAALLWTTTIVRSAAGQVGRDEMAVDVHREFERTVREYNRLGSVSAATQESSIEATRALLESDLRTWIAHMNGYAKRDSERKRVAMLDQQLDGYLAAAHAAARARPPLEQVVRSLRVPFERMIATNLLLKQAHEADRRASEARAAHALRLQWLVAMFSTLLLLLGLAAVTFSMQKLVLRPIRDLRSAVQRFRSGNAGERASGGPLTELSDLTERFNEMTDAIARQRRDQLTFLAAVAHDLRNPLAGVKMIVQALERDPTAATPDRYKRLDRQIDRLTRLVDDLLDATRIESGQLELRLEEFDLRQAAEAMVELYAPTTASHEIQLTASDEPVFVHGDPLRLEQVISNLISNAIKYSPGGGPVEVRVSAAHGEAELAVSDRGTGIAPEELPELFRPFRRRTGSAAVAPGVGLGLSIVRRIVTAHNGHIDVESVLDLGSTFRVRLPLAHGMGLTTDRSRAAGEPEIAHRERR